MADLSHSIHIDAPREKVWNTMLNDAPYRQWAATFMEGSYYEGDWSEGSKMLFLGPDAEGGTASGMASMVKENRPQEFVSLEHVAEVHSGVEVPWKEVGYENYTLEDEEGGTKVTVELLNIPDEYEDMFNGMWPEALKKLKEISEK